MLYTFVRTVLGAKVTCRKQSAPGLSVLGCLLTSVPLPSAGLPHGLRPVTVYGLDARCSRDAHNAESHGSRRNTASLVVAERAKGVKKLSGQLEVTLRLDSAVVPISGVGRCMAVNRDGKLAAAASCRVYPGVGKSESVGGGSKRQGEGKGKERYRVHDRVVARPWRV